MIASRGRTSPVGSGSLRAAAPLAASVTTLSALTSSFTLTGIAAAFQVQQPETKRTFAEAGNAAVFRVAIASTTRSYSETGQPAALRISLGAVSRSYTETGQAGVFR